MAWNDKEEGEDKKTNTYHFEGEDYNIYTHKDGERGIYYLIPNEERTTWCAEWYTISRLNRIIRKKKKESELKKTDDKPAGKKSRKRNPKS